MTAHATHVPPAVMPHFVSTLTDADKTLAIKAARAVHCATIGEWPKGALDNALGALKRVKADKQAEIDWLAKQKNSSGDRIHSLSRDIDDLNTVSLAVKCSSHDMFHVTHGPLVSEKC